MTTADPSRVLILTHEYPYESGDASFIRDEITAIAEAFDEVHILSLRGQGSQAILPANCHHIGRVGRIRPFNVLKGLLSPRRLWKLLGVLGTTSGSPRRKLEDTRAALYGIGIASHPSLQSLMREGRAPMTIYSFWGVDIAYALPWVRQHADAVAVRVHRYDYHEESAGYRPLRRAILGGADTIFTISRYSLDYLVERYPYVRDDRVVVRRLGTRNDADTTALVPRAGSGVRIVSCSSVIPLKRVGLILDSIAAFSASGRDVSWTHLGGGPGFDSLVEQVRMAMASHPRLTVALPGALPHSQVMTLLRDGDFSLFVNLSTIEGVPVSVMEAASFGIPSVATAVGATSELVGRELRSGILVSADPTIEEVVAAMTDVIDAQSGDFDSQEIWREKFDSVRNAKFVATTLRALRE